MRHFSARELGRLQATQNGAMQDLCRIGTFQGDHTDAYGLPDGTAAADLWVYGDAVICGFQHLSPHEEQQLGQVPVVNGKIRLPLGTTISNVDRIRIEKRYGVVLGTPEIYEIEGPVVRGPSGLQVNVRVVDDGTDLPHGA